MNSERPDQNISNKRMKYIVFVTISVILDIALHILTSDFTVIPGNVEWSGLAQRLSVPLTSALWAVLAFSCVAYVFSRFHNRIPGKGVVKGIRYGVAIGLLWLVATMAGVSSFGNLFINELVTGVSDAIPVVVLGWLLGGLTSRKESGNEWETPSVRRSITSITVFTLVFFIGRYIAYKINLIESGFENNPVYTLLWTAVMGATIGFAYLLLGKAARTESLTQSAITFALGIFGVNWAIFGVFMPMLFKNFLLEFVFVVVLDTLMVFISYVLTERINFKGNRGFG